MFYCKQCAMHYGLTMTHTRFPARCEICQSYDFCGKAETDELEPTVPLYDSREVCSAQLQAS